MPTKLTKNDINKILDILEKMYPDAECALNHENIFQLIVAVVLSAQTTDKSVNAVTPILFARYPNVEALAEADIQDLEAIIRKIGMYRIKAKNIKNLAKTLVNVYGGQVPSDYDKLIKLPGVGRKTANVVLAVGFGKQRVAVDTHVFRVANRIGLAKADNVLDTELQLMKNLPKNRLSKAHHSLIFHGRNCCNARKPQCDICRIKEFCNYYSTNFKDREGKNGKN